MRYENTNEDLLRPTFGGKKNQPGLEQPPAGSCVSFMWRKTQKKNNKNLVSTTSPPLWWLRGLKDWQGKREDLGNWYPEREFKFKKKCTLMWGTANTTWNVEHSPCFRKSHKCGTLMIIKGDQSLSGIKPNEFLVRRLHMSIPLPKWAI